VTCDDIKQLCTVCM